MFVWDVGFVLIWYLLQCGVVLFWIWCFRVWILCVWLSDLMVCGQLFGFDIWGCGFVNFGVLVFFHFGLILVYCGFGPVAVWFGFHFLGLFCLVLMCAAWVGAVCLEFGLL